MQSTPARGETKLFADRAAVRSVRASKSQRYLDGGSLDATRRRRRAARFALFLEFRPDAGALQIGQIVDEQLTFQMIHLMLNTHGEQTFSVDFE